MARLNSKNKDSYKGSGSWKKYYGRRGSKKRPTLEKAIKKGSKKSTAKWCKGKVGHPHCFVLTDRYWSKWFQEWNYTLRCRYCNKKKFIWSKKQIPIYANGWRFVLGGIT